MKNKFLNVLIILVAITISTSCQRNNHDPRLDKVATQIDSKPDKALFYINSINSAELNNDDRYFLKLLKIKATDRCFIIHKSDSAILEVLEYYSDNKKPEILTEAIYYAGRVYSDLGDKTRALKYFQKALDRYTENDIFKGKILAQITETLNSLRLYEEAISYITKALQRDSISKDSLGLVYDLKLLGIAYFNLERYPQARFAFDKARCLARKFDSTELSSLDVYSAGIALHENKLDSAVSLIRGVMKQTAAPSHMTLAYACDIYHRAGIRDTAILYAKELLEREDPSNKNAAYEVLLANDMKEFIPRDSMIEYVNAYRSHIERILDMNGQEESRIQNSVYSYKTYERENKHLIKDNKVLRVSVIVFLIILLIGIWWYIYSKFKTKKQILKLRDALKTVEDLKRQLASLTLPNKNNSITESAPVIDIENSQAKETTLDPELDIHSRNKTKELRKKLRIELIQILGREESNKEYTVSESILNSDEYQILATYIQDKKIINDDNPIWRKLEETIIRSHPHFKERLVLLTLGKMKPSEYHIALLLKAGVSPTNMAALVGRSKAAVTYRREILGKRIFDEDSSANLTDSLIRIL